MNEILITHPDTCYQLAEQKAARYFAALLEQVKERTYVHALNQDFQMWKARHVRAYSWLSFLLRGKRKPDSRDYATYIGWMSDAGKLDNYLDRSISYIYLRDLGKALDSPDTQARISQVVADLKRDLLKFTTAKKSVDTPDFLSLAGLYRWAQKEGIEATVIWLMNKLKGVSTHIPESMNPEQAQRKLLKIIVGVVLHVTEETDGRVLPAERTQKLDEAIRLGYSYGLTYPYIDDLLDSKVLSDSEKAQYSEMIRTALVTGAVPDLGPWVRTDNIELIGYIHAELSEAFEYIKNHQRPDTQQTFFEQSYVFFKSQDIDRVKKIDYPHYTNEELYIPIILKSSCSRLIARSVISVPEDEGFDDRTFYYGIYNQLADDFADMFDDSRDGAVTPYTYYLKYHEQRPDLINPFELYWSVIAHLIHDVYRSDAKTREVMLDRAINGLKRAKVRLGSEEYEKIMTFLTAEIPDFNRLVQQMVNKAEDVDFFDKLLRDQLLTVLTNDRKEKDAFLDTVETVRSEINRALPIPKADGILPMKEPLIDAANYSLEGDGKRLRPVLAWVMGVHEYGLEPSAMMPLLKSLEYLHTASLIFDDLPSQDNASTRRGRPTLHQVHNSATAELTGLFLIQKGIQEQTSLDRFDAKIVLALMKYSAEKAEEMCMGQAMDLHSRGKALNLEQLDTICFYKTGIAFEASLVMPAILAQANAAEISGLKKFAYHAGIAFQIKDDLLDLEGDVLLLGKPVGKDAQNNNSTFVSILGEEGAKKQMWEHYCLAMESLKALPRSPVFLKHLLNYIVHRDR